MTSPQKLPRSIVVAINRRHNSSKQKLKTIAKKAKK